MLETYSPEEASVSELPGWLRQLMKQLQNRRQRRVLSIRGDAAWCESLLSVLRAEQHDALLLSDRITGDGALALYRLETLLGSEAPMVIVDLFDGINPDFLCIAAGLINCGGLLVLLSPEIEQWVQNEDKYGIWQDGVSSEHPAFAKYLFNSLDEMPEAGITLRQGGGLPALTDLPVAQPTHLILGETPQQSRVLSQLDDWLQDQQQSIALIEADRGRGKSTCLGIAVRKLILTRQLSVLVTAHSRLAASILLKQVGSQLQGESEVEFIAPDRLIAERLRADVLIVDEAAMLPYPMLRSLCGLYPKVILATTTGGYEGTGQGFSLRFIARLPGHRLRRLSLTAPVRWAEGDCLESWLNSTLFLKPAFEAVDQVSAKHCEFRVVTRKDLNRDIALLGRVYGLMTSAHYRTRPSDLRMLMENPDLFLILAEVDSDLSGLVLLNPEGGFTPALCEQVFLGKRRPRGHLLAQMITAQAGDKTFAGLRGLRVQRIAVLENCRRSGIGSALIEAAVQLGSERSFDYIGASFAFDPETSAFWSHCQFSAAHIGFAAGKSSGNHSLAVLRSLNYDLKQHLVRLQARIQKQLPVWLSQFLQHMDHHSVIALLRYCRFKTDLTAIEKDEVTAFTLGNKGFELCFASLQAFVMQSIAATNPKIEIHPWLVEKAVQNREWNRLSLLSSANGRKQVQQKLRELVGRLPSVESPGETPG